MMDFQYCKLEIFIPESHLPALQKVLWEVTCRTEKVDMTVEAVKQIHPYEEPAINVIPLYRTSF